MDQKPGNPLRAHFRQPSIYIKLPSNGQFWNGGLSLPDNGQIPVYPMTAKDEILLKTPDALLNGQGVVDVIQSCCPHITDAWQTPSVDVDTILIGIRIASYGSTMPVDTKCPHCQTENQFDIDLIAYMDSIILPNYNKKLETHGIKIKLKPQTYASINETNKINYENQRVLDNISADGEDTNKIAEYKQHLNRLVNLNAKLLVDNTEYIEIVDTGTIVNEPEFIEEFYFNCNADICKTLREKLEDFSKEGGIKSQTGSCSSCTKSYDVALTFDYANFFAVRS